MDTQENGQYLINSTGFYKVLVNFYVWHCMNITDTRDNPSNPSILQTASNYLLGTRLRNAWYYLFPPISYTSYHNQENPECELKTDVQLNFMIFYSWIVFAFIVFLAVLTCSITFFISSRILNKKFGNRRRECETRATGSKTMCISNGHVDELEATQEKPATSEKQLTNVIKLPCTNYFFSGPKRCSQTERDVGWFLKNSVDYFYSEMDKFLIHKAPVNLGGAPPAGSVNEQASPTRLMARRVRPRSRSRQTSSPSITSIDPGDEAVVRKAWQEFQTQIVSMGRFSFYDDVDNEMLQTGNVRIQKLSHYYHDYCRLRFEHWNASSLIVNYTLCLLDKVMKYLIDEAGAAFQEFKMSGSILKGVKTSNVNQFDVHMIFRGTIFEVDEVWFQQSSNSIPPGRVVLHTKNMALRQQSPGYTTQSSSSCQSKLLKHCNLTGQAFRCVSSDELTKFAEGLVDRAIQKLYTETRSLIDRLPFRIQRSATANLVLSLDTRHVIGLNLAEIKVQLVPAMYLPLLGWYNMVDIYAVPPWQSRDLKRKPVTVPRGVTSESQTVQMDLQWSLSLGELEAKFLECIAKRMSYAGIHSCHRACISVLKTLFTSVSRKSLLDKGEISSIIIETVVYYLLLESSPQQWSFEKFAERFSDSVHFLKTAFQHGRLPNFFINNPHLIKLMPALSAYPVLVQGRQENLITDVKPDVIDKTLKYIDSRIKEAGLQGCIGEEYSEDMWEYEFFVFN